MSVMPTGIVEDILINPVFTTNTLLIMENRHNVSQYSGHLVETTLDLESKDLSLSFYSATGCGF